MKDIPMAEHSPPDMNRGHGKKRGGTSGKVADFRYKRPSRPEKRSKNNGAKARDAKPRNGRHHSCWR